MKHKFHTLLVVLFLLLYCAVDMNAQNTLKKQIGDTLTVIANQHMWVGNVSVRNFVVNSKKKTIGITTNETLGYLNFREDNVKQIYDAIEAVLPNEYNGYKIYCKVNKHNIEELIPNYYRSKKKDEARIFVIKNDSPPLTTNLSNPHTPTKGLQNKHIAVWQSHGLYYNQTQARWCWQRSRLLQTVEDLYTQSYVLPFLVPMLENAGANVLLPRERDIQIEEIIVDNDNENSSEYTETNGSYKWETGNDRGFANDKDVYLFRENPFNRGTYRITQTTHSEKRNSSIEWIPTIAKKGKYAVYTSYKTIENSTSEAHYTVFHAGGETNFLVNQTMGGGTWIYLGHFDFEENNPDAAKVVLTNYSEDKKKNLTADAVKFGGGMGNISRQPYMPSPVFNRAAYKNNKNKKDTIPFIPIPGYISETSSYPRFTEAARYWLQWAGMPDSIYSRTRGENDYIDDLQSRGQWVNYLSGGSNVQPKEKGLNIPLDLAIAFHSDAGTTNCDSIIGTLAICSTQNSDEKEFYNNNVSRMASRDLTDIIQSQIISDIRQIFAPEWTSRGIWDKLYNESRVPQVPTILLESMSHQNFADMRYGNDPRFKFIFSRAVYKGVLKYMESVYDEKLVVQPLPVQNFSIHFNGLYEIELNWQPTEDTLESSAVADKYIIYTRINDGGFDNGILVNHNTYKLKIEADKIYSFKITAVNEGGESFPSEILSACRTSQNQGEVLIVNAFDRICAPTSFMKDSTLAGFLHREDPGIPYLYDASFTGEQYEFNRSEPWKNDDAPGFGASHAQYETQIIAGNTFDYPYIHGKAIKEADYSFVSSSKGAILSGNINMNNYRLVDLIMGNQKQTLIGNGQKGIYFKTFPLDLQEKINQYCSNGGNIFISGSYIASDMNGIDGNLPSDKLFIEKVLKYRLLTSQGCATGNVKIIQSPSGSFKQSHLTFYDSPNEDSYYAVTPNAIEPIDKNGFVFCRYSENNISAGVAYQNKNYKVCALAFPFEIIKEESERVELMHSILMFLNPSKTIKNSN